MKERSTIELSEEVIKNKDRFYAENISKGEGKLKIAAKENIFPIILGCYDRNKAEKELENLRDSLKKEFPNARLLKDIPDIDGVDYNRKFKHYVNDLIESGGLIFPIICLHPVLNEGKGHGLINEIRDITDVFHHRFILKTLILKHQKVKSFEHIKYFPNRKEIKNSDEALKAILSHLNKNLGWIEYRELLKSCKTINFYNPDTIHLNEEVIKNE